jgi:4-hydroxybenzoyl-CoA thioesterase
VYAGGVRFYQALRIGDLVEVEARLIFTGRTSMHVSVHVRSGNPAQLERRLTTHCLIVFVALAPEGTAIEARPWEPTTEEDVQLFEHAKHLIDLRAAADDITPT